METETHSSNVLKVFGFSFLILCTVGISVALATLISTKTTESVQQSLAPVSQSVSELTNTVTALQAQMAAEAQKETTPTYTHQSGDTVLVSEYYEPWQCSTNGDPCEKLYVTTQIDLTEPSMGDELTGRFYIRAYDSVSHYTNKEPLDELQITRNFNPFAGDGGEPAETDTAEIMTITSKDPVHVVPNVFSSKFYLEYTEAVPGLNTPGYILRLATTGEESDFNGRFVDFYFDSSSNELNISLPQ